MLKSKKFTLLPKYTIFERLRESIFLIYFPNVDFLMIKGKPLFAIYFPNVDLLMIKGKQRFIIFQVLASILGFYLLGVITLFIS